MGKYIRYTDEFLARVREDADLVGIIGRDITLKKAGKAFKACCPFHGEKTPSFEVSPERNTYKLRIPRSSGHPFHEHLTTDSTVIRPPIPRVSDH